MLKILSMIFIIFFGQAFAWSEANSAGRSCVLAGQDFAEVGNCLLTDKDGGFFIASHYLKKLSFGENGLAAVYEKEEGWMYVNRKGRVTITGVASMDNGADVFHDGLVRFSKNSKWGFADEKGKIIVPAVYDGALNFKDGLAQVCKSCVLECVNKECEQHYFSGGEWLYINTRGIIVKNNIGAGNNEQR